MQPVRAGVLIALATVLVAAVPASAVERPSPRIVNGHTTADAQYPWTVALVNPQAPTSAFCGGTLIAPNVVLTAAHCTIGFARETVGVVAGRRVLTGVTQASPEYFAVTRQSLHPVAEGGEDDLIPRRDVSLLTLDGNAGSLPNAEPIDLGTEADLQAAITSGTDLEVSGWGLLEDGGDGTPPDRRAATVDPVADAGCDTTFTEHFAASTFDASDQVCAIRDPDADPETENDVVDTCNGDSGGPLVGPSPTVVGSPDVTDATDWVLFGATSWGLGCALTLPDPTTGALEVIPGVYARVPSDEPVQGVVSLVDYADQATDGTDTAPEQPQLSDPADQPAIAAGEGTVSCVGNELSWEPSPPDEIDYLIRQVFRDPEDPDDVIGFATVSTLGSFAPGTDGGEFLCEVRARNIGAGGYGVARSDSVLFEGPGPVDPEVVEIPVPVEVPVPTPVAVPGPTLTINRPDARDTDGTDPRVRSVSRRCTTRRVCTFTVRATDDATGVKSLAATLNTVRTRSCRRNGRRTTCASWRATALRPRPIAGQAGTFRITTSRLARGSHTLHVRAVDGAGNVQVAPRRVTFRLR